MIPALIILALLVAVGTALWLTDRHHPADDETPRNDTPQAADPCSDDCCGTNDVCPSEKILNEELKREITYYDDEELDRYAGQDPKQYTDDDTEQFRDVLYTLLPEDRRGWERSLKRRHIALPEGLRDELVMLIAESASITQRDTNAIKRHATR